MQDCNKLRSVTIYCDIKAKVNVVEALTLFSATFRNATPQILYLRWNTSTVLVLMVQLSALPKET